MTRRSAVVGLVLAGSSALSVGLMPAAGAAAGSYVALGDSYSAGVGTRAKVDSCYRSPYGYPALVASRYGLSLSYQACSGATTADVTNNQLGALSSGTSLVSMTIGGNDVGFANVITTCAQPSWLSDCNGAIANGRSILTNQLPGRYDSLFGSIRTKAPNAKVAIGGYPLIFNGEDCNALTFFSPTEEASLNSATNDLDSLIRTKATARGFSYVDPRSSFSGHAVCDNVEWINGLSSPIEESYHPNRDGNVGYAKLFGPALTGTSYLTTTTAAKTSSTARTRHAADAVLAMNLTSSKNLAKAQAAGVSTREVKRLTTMLRSTDAGTVADGLAGLKQLDRQAAAGR
ncbi:SGNH/GDSL hydrolase family protein [Luteipulveratus sp. YIM 133132]|uniref:SGNH/GDSL hydrolase family protein n=1 Tax=Luteipulveratus flavus TaxID=3031728 RepID=UPI0023AF173C|nr:SGNH/GDSL hydrolase family protein [Luteipulveratus sp. YIM 133132]MDE9364830.1 SGNH/GDSL hydrolase family protein [Luteipulveratus sp. YIM 133132]